MSYSKANADLKGILRQYQKEYADACEASRVRYMSTLQPGTKVPDQGKLYTEADKDAFASKARVLREQAQAITGGVLKDLKVKTTVAPSTDAVNTISLLAMRKNVTAEEINDLLEQYGADCPQAWRAIKDIASKHEILAVADHPVDAFIEAVEHVESSVCGLISPYRTEVVPDGLLSMIDMSIDNALPTD